MRARVNFSQVRKPKSFHARQYRALIDDCCSPNTHSWPTMHWDLEQATEAKRLIDFVGQRGVARARDIDREGFHRATLSRLVQQGRLQRLSRGIYSLTGHDFTEWHQLAELCKAVPTARIALISALAFHGIGTQVPYETWVVLPVGAWTPSVHHRLRIARFAEPYYSAGIEIHPIEGVDVPIYNAAKTVADCFKMRSKVGYDVAVEALREGWRARKFTMDDLSRYARLNRVERIMRPYIEAIIG